MTRVLRGHVDSTCEVVLANGDPELWEAITFDSKIRFGHTYSRWKALDEKETLVPSIIDLEMSKKK
jgi:hypothetical protein